MTDTLFPFSPPADTYQLNIIPIFQSGDARKSGGLVNCVYWFVSNGFGGQLNYENIYVKGCTTYLGGVYNPELSQSLVDLDPSSFLDGTENIKFGEYVFNSYNFSYKYQARNHLGMGPKSDLLQRFVDEKRIGSKSWGYDQGRDGGDPYGLNSQPEGKVDGLFSLGGYDASRIIGEKYYQAIDPGPAATKDCQVVVDVTDITLNDSEGSRTLGGKPFKSVIPMSISNYHKLTASRACLDPAYDYISIPNSTFQQFNRYQNNRYTTRAPASTYCWYTSSIP